MWKSKRGGSLRKKILAEQSAAKKAKEFIKAVSKENKLYILAALYWAEGSKSDLSFTNSDPQMIKIFIDGLEEVFEISKLKMKVSIRIYEDLDREKCLNYWSVITGIPKEKFISVNILKGKKVGKLQYGMCRVRVEKGGDLLKYFRAIKNEIVDLSSPRSSTDRAQVS